MKRINIMFLMPVMGMGGSERLVRDLAYRLDRSRFNPSIAWLSESEALREFQDLDVPLHRVPKTRRIDLPVMRELARIIESERVDIVDAQHFMPAVYAYYGCNVVGRKALIFTAHSRWEIEDTPYKWRVAGGYLLRRMAACVGVAPEVSKAVRRVFGTSPSQTVTIENGVDIDLFAQKRDVHALRAGLGVAEGDLVIGIVANLKKVKNHLFLMQAFARLAEEVERVKLMIVGQGFAGDPDNTERDLRLFVDDYRLAERVLFLGYRPDIAELLQVMDVFCLTSLREGLPISLAEAMASGLPVVGSNVEGIGDVITPERDGILVELGDIAGLTNALTRLVRDPGLRQRLGKGGREKAEERYSLQRCVRQYERLFFSVAGCRAGSRILPDQCI